MSCSRLLCIYKVNIIYSQWWYFITDMKLWKLGFHCLTPRQPAWTRRGSWILVVYVLNQFITSSCGQIAFLRLLVLFRLELFSLSSPRQVVLCLKVLFRSFRIEKKKGLHAHPGRAGVGARHYSFSFLELCRVRRYAPFDFDSSPP